MINTEIDEVAADIIRLSVEDASIIRQKSKEIGPRADALASIIEHSGRKLADWHVRHGYAREEQK